MSDTATLQRLYEAFARLDADTMRSCYADDAHFEDPVFALDGRDAIGAMWGMLADAVKAKGRDVWKLDFSGIEASGGRGRAHWEATYRFSATGRMVHNVIDAEFELRDGLIRRHVDRFDFWRWSRQALGPAGVLLGWTPLLHNKVKAQAAANLARHRSR